MIRGSGLPYFLWQEQQRNQNWKTLSHVEVCDLNEAAAKDKKKLTLLCTDRRKKLTVCFEKMISRNTSGDEKKVRCVILNNESLYAIWTWYKSDEDNFISYLPRMMYFLELMFQKKVPKVDFYYKTDFEVDFLKFTIKDRQTGILYNIRREEIDFIHPRWNKLNMNRHVLYIFESKRLMRAMLPYSVDRIKNLLLNVPITSTEVSCSSSLPLPSKDVPISSAEVSCSFSLPLPSKQCISILKKEEETPNDRLMTVDPCFSVCENNPESYVVSENGCIFSATLILTNLDANVNKFCILQLLKVKSRKKFMIWSRHGRVGYDGQGETSETFSNLKDAQEEFEGLFYERTQNHWSDRYRFQRKPKKYDYIRTYFNAGFPEDIFNNPLEIIQSKLDKTVQEVLLLICGADMGFVIKTLLLRSVATEVGLPTVKQLLEAFTALNEIGNLLTLKIKGKELIEACNNYYMKIPRKTKYDAPKVIVSAEKIDGEIYMLQTLAYMTVNAVCNSMENPVDLYFQRFQWSLTHLDHRSQEFMVLEESLLGLQGPTHKYNMHLLDAFKWHKKSETERFVDKGNKMLLWHGTQLSNFLGIIKHGLKLPPVEEPTRFSMFGRALYFADVSSKSANYCLPTKKNDTALLLLCEVSMGIPLKVFRSGDYSSHPSLVGGVIAIGEYNPSEFTKNLLAPDALIPKGPLIRRDNTHISLKYNEYVVYDERQVKIIYILKVKFS